MKFLISLIFILNLNFLFSQVKDEFSQIEEELPISKGKVLLEVNTSSNSGDTGFYFSSLDGTDLWRVGGEGGYFFSDGLAVTTGLGYESQENRNRNKKLSSFSFSYKVGLKYYIEGKIPVQVDFLGVISKVTLFNFFESVQNDFYIGLQGGYAFFLGKNVSIEPGVRYSILLDSDSTVKNNLLAIYIGFVIHL